MAAFSLPAVVTPPGGAAVETRALWLPPTTAESPATDHDRAEAMRVVALPLDGLPNVPRGTVIVVAAYAGGTALSWKVDAADRVDWDHYRALVRPIS